MRAQGTHAAPFRSRWRPLPAGSSRGAHVGRFTRRRGHLAPLGTAHCGQLACDQVVRGPPGAPSNDASLRFHGVLATFSIHTTPCMSRHPPVVVMQATDDRECHDTTVSLGHSRQRLFLPEALVWPRLVVEAGVLRDEAQKMALAKQEDMVEQFAPESADKALGEGVHVRGPDRGANDLGTDGFEQAREAST